MVHTAFASREKEALDKYNEMKQCILSFLSTNTSEKEISDWCNWFANKF